MGKRQQNVTPGKMVNAPLEYKFVYVTSYLDSSRVLHKLSISVYKPHMTAPDADLLTQWTHDNIGSWIKLGLFPSHNDCNHQLLQGKVLKILQMQEQHDELMLIAPDWGPLETLMDGDAGVQAMFTTWTVVSFLSPATIAPIVQAERERYGCWPQRDNLRGVHTRSGLRVEWRKGVWMAYSSL